MYIYLWHPINKKLKDFVEFVYCDFLIHVLNPLKWVLKFLSFVMIFSVKSQTISDRGKLTFHCSSTLISISFINWSIRDLFTHTACDISRFISLRANLLVGFRVRRNGGYKSEPKLNDVMNVWRRIIYRRQRGSGRAGRSTSLRRAGRKTNDRHRGQNWRGN